MAFVACWVAVLWIVLTAAVFAESAGGVRVVAAYWPTRQGISTRVLVMLPKEERAGLILLPGGHGNINLSSQAQIGWGVDDFVIRTRATYAQAGFVTVVPDVATDRKPPVDLGDYRRSELQAEDLAAIADRMRRIGEQVFVVAYDRGVTSALNAAGRGKLEIVSSLVLISPILERDRQTASILDDGARFAFGKLPVLMISHSLDKCSAAAVNHLKEIAADVTARDFQSISVTGGSDEYQLRDPLGYPRDPCNKNARHALGGLETDVSASILDWLTKHTAAKR